MCEEYVILSERQEEMQKAAEWAKNQKELREMGELLADKVMEKMTPLILQRKAEKMDL